MPCRSRGAGGLTGLTTDVLARPPRLADVSRSSLPALDRQMLVGHNIGVDWRLLHRRLPTSAPGALIDTLRLARRLELGAKNSLTALTAQLGLVPATEALAVGSQPHRALWDAAATALLLPALITCGWPQGATLDDLLAIAAIDPTTHP